MTIQESITHDKDIWTLMVLRVDGWCFESRDSEVSFDGLKSVGFDATFVGFVGTAWTLSIAVHTLTGGIVGKEGNES